MVYQRLEMIAAELIYRQNWGPQEIEFTFQGARAQDLYVLQSRNMAPRVKREHPAFKPDPQLDEAYLASGIGVSGGALCGRIAFDLGALIRLKKTYPLQPIILIRSDTVPDDIHEISISEGILTGKGGATSHAAIVAHRLGKTCVVGCSKLRVWESEGRCLINGRPLETGDMIGIDGQSGAIYVGEHEIHRVERLD
jgi:pyruvate,orthophosphate dikinase